MQASALNKDFILTYLILVYMNDVYLILSIKTSLYLMSNYFVGGASGFLD